MEHFKHIIVGTGQAAGTLLGKLIPKGDPIAVIESDKVGGSCVNYGCTPTKTLVASARAYHLAKEGSRYGFDIGTPVLDYSRVRERMNRIRNESREGLAGWMEESGNVELIRGQGRFTAEKTLQVGSRELKGEQIYINVGTRPRLPEIEGIEGVGWMDSARLLEKEALPGHLLIIGGGYVGTEFAQVYRRFGSEVTLIHHGDRIMGREDEDVAEAIQDFLREEGVGLMLNTRPLKVYRTERRICIQVERAGRTETVEGTDLLVAAGRLPNSDTIHPAAGGLATDERGFLKVNDFCETGVPGVFAVGDVNGKGAFTHTSVNDAEIVLDRLFGGDRRISQRNTVYALFTDPPLGRVGMTEKQALASGKRVLKAVRPMSRISRAKEMGETRGFAKLLVDGDTDLILGAAVLGVGGDEVINMFAAIMHSGIPCREYRKAVLVHPTVSELMPWILDGIREAGETSSQF